MHPSIPRIAREIFPVLTAVGFILLFISRLPELRRRSQETLQPQDLLQLGLHSSQKEEAD